MGDSIVLVTGATGFVGGATTAHLLRSGRASRVCLLVRGETQAGAEGRARRSLARFIGPDVLAQALTHCEVIRGDLTDEACFSDRRLDDLTHVIHAAANTSFRSVRSVRATNVGGTLRLVERLVRSSRLKRFLHVGTAYICGVRPPAVVHEDDYPRGDAEHLVEYTRAKAEAEMLLERRASEVPLVVARPSVVVGHTRLGCLPSASIFWYYRTVDLLRCSSAPVDSRKDIVPVDFVAAALVHLLFKAELAHSRYHISAGEGSSVTWREIGAAFARCRGEEPAEPYRVASVPEILEDRVRLRERLGAGDEERLLRALEAYYRFSASGAEVFDNRRLLEEGIEPPPKFTEYLPVCVARSGNRSLHEQMSDDE